MATIESVTTSQKVREALERGMKKGALYKMAGISKNTFKKRLEDNSWELEEIANLRRAKIL